MEVIGSTAAGVEFALTVVVYGGTLGGTYTCNNDGGFSGPSVSIVYSGASTADDCTINIDAAGAPGGAHATGSFSATLNAVDGGLIAVTDGHFDTPVTSRGG